jgi:integrase
MRPRGSGTIEPCAGGFRARLPGRGARRLPGIFATEAEADRLLDAALASLAESSARHGVTLASWGHTAIDRREIAGQRAARSYRSVWRAHVADTPLGARLLVHVTTADVRAWVAGLATRRVQPGHGHGDAVKRKRAREVIAKSTAQNALNLLRVVLRDAVESGLVTANAAKDVELPTAIRKRQRHDKGWTYLLPDEQRALVTSPTIPLRERLALAFALGTGARQREQWAIRIADLNLADGLVTLRETKNGKPRTVPLLPIARLAVDHWLEIRPASPWLWCSVRGHRRSSDPRDWQKWTEAALPASKRHDGRHVRWHDLRHSCATSLVQGWWGRAWSLEEVRDQLDHESVTTTERYAHLDGGIARKAAALTKESPGPALAMLENPFAPPGLVENPTFGLGSRRASKRGRAVAPDASHQVVTGLRTALTHLAADPLWALG